jgi:hypothetical protein
MLIVRIGTVPGGCQASDMIVQNCVSQASAKWARQMYDMLLTAKQPRCEL